MCCGFPFFYYSGLLACISDSGQEFVYSQSSQNQAGDKVGGLVGYVWDFCFSDQVACIQKDDGHDQGHDCGGKQFQSRYAGSDAHAEVIDG